MTESLLLIDELLQFGDALRVALFASAAVENGGYIFRPLVQLIQVAAIVPLRHGDLDSDCVPENDLSLRLSYL